MKATVTVTLENVDWEMLREQKEKLIRVVSFRDLGATETEALQGILNFLDHIQDQAVDAGLSEETVFGK